MSRINIERFISASPSQVFELVSNPIYDVKWSSDVKWVVLKDGTHGLKGAVYIQKLKSPMGEMEGEVEIDTMIIGKAIKYLINAGPIKMIKEYFIDSVESGNKLTLKAEIKGLMAVTMNGMLESKMNSEKYISYIQMVNPYSMLQSISKNGWKNEWLVQLAERKERK